ELSKGLPYVSTAAIRAPRGSEVMAWAWSACEARDTSQLRWGETGPALLASAVEHFGLHDAVEEPAVFCPIPYIEWRRAIDPHNPDLPACSAAVHLWNEMWRREGCDKDAAWDPECLYERLKREMRCGAEIARTG